MFLGDGPWGQYLTRNRVNSTYASRGAWVTGPRAVLLLALYLGLKVRPSWRRRHGLESASLESLRSELLEAPVRQ